MIATPPEYEFFENMLVDLTDQFTKDAPTRTFIKELSTSVTADTLTGVVQVTNPAPSTVQWFQEHTPRGYGLQCSTSTRALTVEITISLDAADDYKVQARNVVRQRVALAATVAVCMGLVLVLAFA